MRKLYLFAPLIFVAAAASNAVAQQKQDAPSADAVINSAFESAPAEWKSRISQDKTMQECSAYKNNPPKAVAEAISKLALSTIQYPADGNFIGDWKKGEALAQSGYGMRFTDYPPVRQNGGNCYACHQLAERELSYGTIGPSLLNYGKLKEFKDAEVKRVYERIYNSHASLPCSNMPRFGENKILSIEQIRDIVALLMSPDSPVNK
jgi:sulfur-oxidizing protein SoxX